jgi:diadenosine tetraphosphatase ApaH/serine/threonine PP2A family protein phosphatase
VQSLAGNHDLAAIGALDTSTFNPTARLAAVWTHHQLAPGQTEFIRRLPSITHLAEATLAHGSPCSPVWEYVTSAEAATENFRCFDGPLCLIGHSHIALAARLEATRHYAELWPLAPGDIVDLDSGRFMINPGSVGQPRDHDPRAAFGVLDTGQRVYTSFRVEYDIAATQRQMEQAGLPDSLNRRLSIGV